MPSEIDAVRKAFSENPKLHDRLRMMFNRGKLGTEADIPPDEELVVVAAMDHGGIFGAKQVSCSECPAKVWIAPSTQEMLSRRGDAPTKIVCTLCVLKSMKEMREKT
jgi:hypothetical protein